MNEPSRNKPFGLPLRLIPLLFTFYHNYVSNLDANVSKFRRMPYSVLFEHIRAEIAAEILYSDENWPLFIQVYVRRISHVNYHCK